MGCVVIERRVEHHLFKNAFEQLFGELEKVHGVMKVMAVHFR